MSVALVATALALVTRALIEILVPGVVPFALLFPAMLGAALLAGWASGAITLVLGGLLTWWLVRQTEGMLVAGAPETVVSLALYVVAGGTVVALAEAYRTVAGTLARERRALLESEARLDLATRAAGLGVWDWDLRTNAMICSEEAKLILGLPADEPVTRAQIVSATHRADRDHTWAQVRRALDPAIRDLSPYEYRIVRRNDGRTRWVWAIGEPVFETVDGRQTAVRYVGTIQDITDRKLAEDAVRASEQRLRLALEAGRMAVWRMEVGAGLIPTPELNRLLGFAPDARPSVEEILDGYLPGEQDRVRGVMEAALARGERFFEVEYRHRRQDGAVLWLLNRSELTLDAQGRPVSALGVVMDITDRKADEERLKLLAREVDHRANNLMTVVQGTVSLSQADTPEALKDVIVGRVAALARAHQLLSETRWEGADLRRLVEEELLAFSLGAATRVTIRGEDLALPPAAAQSLAMALHELATNAAKYGALSRPEGRVEVAWAGGGRAPLLLTWTETGGPRVSPPRRRGLGTAILERALGGALGGRSRLEWRPQGLVCELELPATAAAQDKVN
ncbi:PAS domain-containing protein [Phenylobacterium sp. J426]|uniref:PAS domain-containing protein n=1 Tax=Phenylobacterium sp. J426 TaxID=2898439 RepID=UPI002150AEB9|nr:PAS domain-containing protein [Phenylobacterium sp. J426]MCR5875061.1 PAS domain-containing protein [Phenylobacterium sp. J426]